MLGLGDLTEVQREIVAKCVLQGIDFSLTTEEDRAVVVIVCPPLKFFVFLNGKIGRMLLDVTLVPELIPKNEKGKVDWENQKVIPVYLTTATLLQILRSLNNVSSLFQAEGKLLLEKIRSFVGVNVLTEGQKIIMVPTNELKKHDDIMNKSSPSRPPARPPAVQPPAVQPPVVPTSAVPVSAVQPPAGKKAQPSKNAVKSHVKAEEKPVVPPEAQKPEKPTDQTPGDTPA